MKQITVILSVLIFCSAVIPKQKDELGQSIVRGKAIYADHCASCHMEKGEGIEGNFPPLAKADYLTKFPEKSIAAVKLGMEGKITVNGKEYENMMPNPGLEIDQVADVMNYIRNSFGNTNKKIVTPEMVKGVK